MMFKDCLSSTEHSTMVQLVNTAVENVNFGFGDLGVNYISNYPNIYAQNKLSSQISDQSMALLENTCSTSSGIESKNIVKDCR